MATEKEIKKKTLKKNKTVGGRRRKNKSNKIKK